MQSAIQVFGDHESRTLEAVNCTTGDRLLTQVINWSPRALDVPTNTQKQGIIKPMTTSKIIRRRRSVSGVIGRPDEALSSCLLTQKVAPGSPKFVAIRNLAAKGRNQ